MATVTFSNGAKVTFNGTPTQSDIEEVSNTPAVKDYSAPTLLQKGLGVVNDIATPVESVAATPGQAIFAGLNAGYHALTGKSVADPYAQGVPSLGSILGQGTPNTPIAPLTPSGLVQKAGQAIEVGSLAATPETTGVLKMAGLGALSGVGQSLASGNQDLGQLTKDAITSSIYGGALGIVGKAAGKIGSMLKANTGVSEQMANEIAGADTSLISHYIDTTEGHNKTIRISSPDDVADSALGERVKILLKDVIPQAGEAVGTAHANAANLSISLPNDAGLPLTGKAAGENILQQFESRVKDVTGHNFTEIQPDELSLKKTWSTPELTPMPGRSIIMSNKDKEAILQAQQYIKRIIQKPNVQTASDMIKNLDDEIGKHWDVKMLQTGDTPAVSLLKQARGMINSVVKKASPELAAANAKYSALMDLKNEVSGAAGKDLQSGSLLMRRVFSGDKGGDAVRLLDNLSQITQPFIKATDAAGNPLLKGNLVQHAVLAEFAKKNFGNASSRTLLNQYISQDAGFFGYSKSVVQSMAKEATSFLTPDTKQYALALAQGKNYDVGPIGKAIDDALSHASTKPLIGGITQKLIDMGVSASNAKTAAEKLLKVFLVQRLTAPSSTPNQTPQPQTLPSQTPQLSPQPQGGNIPSQNTQTNMSAIRQLTPPTTGQGMSRTLGPSTTPGSLSLGSSLAP